MSLFDDDDIAEMIDAFGEPVTIDTAGDSRTVRAVFDNAYQQEILADGSVATLAPQLQLATADIEETIDPGEVGESGTTATVRGTKYRVVNHQPDGQGFSLLILTQEM